MTLSVLAESMTMYTVGHKKRAPKLLSITLAIISHFDKVCTVLTRKELGTSEYKKCLFSQRVCKHHTVQNQKTMLFT